MSGRNGEAFEERESNTEKASSSASEENVNAGTKRKIEEKQTLIRNDAFFVIRFKTYIHISPNKNVYTSHTTKLSINAFIQEIISITIAAPQKTLSYHYLFIFFPGIFFDHICKTHIYLRD